MLPHAEEELYHFISMPISIRDVEPSILSNFFLVPVFKPNEDTTCNTSLQMSSGYMQTYPSNLEVVIRGVLSLKFDSYPSFFKELIAPCRAHDYSVI